MCRHTRELAPRIHNLVRLSQIAGIDLSDEDLDLLAEVNEFNIEGRYPEMSTPLPTRGEADEYMDKIEQVMQWLNSQS